jgi:tRNA(His) 5'-end guanylyltransferase
MEIARERGRQGTALDGVPPQGAPHRRPVSHHRADGDTMGGKGDDRKLWQRLGLPEPKSEASRGDLSCVDNEVYSGIEVPDMPVFVRLDGWGFHSLAMRLRLAKPFDERFARALATTAGKLFVPFTPDLAYVCSDEISLLFLRSPIFQRVEKVDSVFAGFASTTFLIELTSRFADVGSLSFDCRCIPLMRDEITRYLRWRQAETFRNHNNAWAQFALEQEGLSPRAAAGRLHGLKTGVLRELLLSRGIDPDQTPVWQRRGVLLTRETYTTRGFDPVAGEEVVAVRHRVAENWSLPIFSSDEGRELLRAVVG